MGDIKVLPILSNGLTRGMSDVYKALTVSNQEIITRKISVLTSRGFNPKG
ncbi:hypothetical protein GGR92_003247 [Spirosoma lacussanchae]